MQPPTITARTDAGRGVREHGESALSCSTAHVSLSSQICMIAGIVKQTNYDITFIQPYWLVLVWWSLEIVTCIGNSLKNGLTTLLRVFLILVISCALMTLRDLLLIMST